MDSVTLEAGGVVDVAYSPDQSLLYAAMRNGDVNVYNVVTGQKIATWHVGTQLGGISVSEDGSFLLVVERQPAANSATFYRVDTGTGAALAVTTAGPAFRDVEIVDGDTALLTGGGAASQSSQQTLYNLQTGAFSGLANSVHYSGWGTVLAEDGHLTLLAEPGISNGPLFLFDDRTDTIVARGDNYQTIGATGTGSYTGFNFGSQAVSEAAGLVLQFIYYNTVLVYDLDLEYLRHVPVAGQVDGMVFDPTGRYVYIYEIESGYLAKYEVATWTRVDQFQVGTSTWHNDIGYGSQLLINDDGSRITIVDTDADIGKLRIVDLGAHDQYFGGTGGADSFAGGAGNDTYLVNHSGDFVSELASQGEDEVETSLASYVLGANLERLTGVSASGQFLQGNAAANAINGGDGDDRLLGGGGGDVVHGGGGNDLARGDDGDDRLFGDSGNDNLRGGRGVDSFDGGANDALSNPVGSYGDKVSFYEQAATQGAVADLRTGIIANDGFGNAETMVNVELLGDGTAFADTFHGNDNSNALLGGFGDSLHGLGGRDYIYLSGAPALADGGAGSDLLVLQHDSGPLVPDSDGDGLADPLDAMTAGWEVDIGSGFVRDGYGHEGSLQGFEDVRGSDLGDLISGNSGANALEGGGGDDSLSGKEGGDALDGGAGNDLLDGGSGADQLAGGPGDDVYLLDAADIVTEAAGAGTDEIRTSLASVGLAAYANVENLTGTSAGGQSLTGNGGDNVVTAGAGNDVLRLYDGGDDTAYGGAGNDNIFFIGALTGADIVNGGTGVDTLVLQGPYGSLTLTANITQIENVSILGGNNTSFGEPGTNRYDYGLTTNDFERRRRDPGPDQRRCIARGRGLHLQRLGGNRRELRRLRRQGRRHPDRRPGQRHLLLRRGEVRLRRHGEWRRRL